MRFSYPCKLSQDDDGVWIATCRDVPEALTDGLLYAEAKINMSHALGAALAGYVKEKQTIPTPSSLLAGECSIPIPALIACKLMLRQRMSNLHCSNVALAQKLGVSEAVVRRLLDPDHASKMEGIMNALEALGHGIIIESFEFETI